MAKVDTLYPSILMKIIGLDRCQIPSTICYLNSFSLRLQIFGPIKRNQSFVQKEVGANVYKDWYVPY